MSRPAFNPVKPREIGTPEKCIAELFEQAGGIKRVMVKLGVSQSTAYGYTERDTDCALSFARVAALTEPGVTAGAEYLSLLAGGVHLPIAPEESDPATLCAADVRAHGEAIAAVIADLDGHVVSAEEARAALVKIDAALRTLTGLRAAMVQAAAKTKR